MTSLYDVLRAEKLHTSDAYAELMAKALKGSIHEYTGSVPYTFTANGQPLLDCSISGNMSQSGTPTLSNPIYPAECGDLVESGEHAGQYKIPISCGGTVTNVYLGAVQSTRQIAKYVITGAENWEEKGSGNSKRFQMMTENYMTYTSGICSHFPYNTISQSGTETGFSFVQTNGQMRVRPENVSSMSLSDWKNYLSTQYQSNTPVTIWYVLGTPTTGTINEPLRKIGDYADSVSNAATVPTTRGSNTLSVGTAVQPSEVYIKYKR